MDEEDELENEARGRRPPQGEGRPSPIPRHPPPLLKTSWDVRPSCVGEGSGIFAVMRFCMMKMLFSAEHGFLHNFLG